MDKSKSVPLRMARNLHQQRLRCRIQTTHKDLLTVRTEESEDGDLNIEAAARFRQLLKLQSQATFDPLHQSMLEMQQLAEDVGLSDTLDYDDNIDDLDLEIY